MRSVASVALVSGVIALLLVAGCADVKATQKVGDFGTAFGASADEQKAIDWFKTTHGDPLSNNDQPARFVEPLITSGLSDKNLPIDKVTTFPVNGGSVFFFVIYDNFKKGDPIAVSWTYLENGKEVTSVQQQAGGDFGRFIVEFQKPDSGWGKGKQRITVSGDGATASVDFVIGDSLETTPLPYNPEGEQGMPSAVTGSNSVTTIVTTLTKDRVQEKTTLQDTLNRRGSSSSCPSGQILCDGECVDLSNNLMNCGSCGNHCPAGHGVDCINGKCGCSDSSKSYCDGACYDLRNDLNNCGSCNNYCKLEGKPANDNSVQCINGYCGCPQYYTNCNSDCTLTTIDIRNCGACGNTCNSNEVCWGGSCLQCKKDYIVCQFEDDPVMMCCPKTTGCSRQCLHDGTGVAIPSH